MVLVGWAAAGWLYELPRDGKREVPPSVPLVLGRGIEFGVVLYMPPASLV